MTHDADKPAAEGAAKPARKRFLTVGPADGYTLTGQCTDESRPTLTFTYRPASPEQVWDYRELVIASKGGAQRMQHVADFLGRHLLTWDLMQLGAGGEPVPLPFTPAALNRPDVRLAIAAGYFDTMVNFVCGYTQGEWRQDEKN